MELITAKSIIKSLVSPVVDLCGIYDTLLERRVYSQPCWLILMYHRIVDRPDADPFRLGMCVDRAHLAEQIEFLTRTFTPLTVGAAVTRIRAGRALPRYLLSVTFDDGYRDFAQLAVPVLRRYQCPATLYVSTGGIDAAQPFWWDRVIEAFARTRRGAFELPLSDALRSTRRLSLGVMQRRNSLLATLDFLWTQPAERLEPLVADIRQRLGVNDAGHLQAPRMNLAEIAQLDRREIELAAHCDNHADLTRMPPDAALHEMAESRRILREAGGGEVTGFAYPGGRHNVAVRRLAAQAGFIYAAGTIKGVNRQPFETFDLRRIGMPNTSIADFKRCLSAAAGQEPRQLAGESVQWP